MVVPRGQCAPPLLPPLALLPPRLLVRRLHRSLGAWLRVVARSVVVARCLALALAALSLVEALCGWMLVLSATSSSLLRDRLGLVRIVPFRAGSRRQLRGAFRSPRSRNGNWLPCSLSRIGWAMWPRFWNLGMVRSGDLFLTSLSAVMRATPSRQGNGRASLETQSIEVFFSVPLLFSRFGNGMAPIVRETFGHLSLSWPMLPWLMMMMPRFRPCGPW